jgi:hypothetical protein
MTLTSIEFQDSDGTSDTVTLEACVHNGEPRLAIYGEAEYSPQDAVRIGCTMIWWAIKRVLIRDAWQALGAWLKGRVSE